MPISDLVEQLERSGQLVRISAEVNADLEIPAITRRVTGQGGPALLFENVRGCRVPVVTNLLGSSERIRQALGLALLDDAAARIAEWLSPARTEAGWLDRLRGGTNVATYEPQVVRSAPSQQVVELGRDVDLGAWPALRSWPIESRHSIRHALLFTRGGSRTVCAVDAEILDRNHLGLVVYRHNGLHDSLAHHTAAGSRMPIAIALGCDARLELAASLPVGAFDPLVLAGVLGQRPVDLVKCRTHDAEVAADAEIVIEGTIDPAEPLVPAGTLGAETGYAAPASMSLRVEVAAITHRLNPLFSAVVVGPSPSETGTIRAVTERWWQPFVEQLVPQLVDYDLGASIGPQQFAVFSIRKTRPFEARRVMAAVWSAPWLMFSKFVVIVDEHVDVHDHSAVLRAIGANVDPARDLVPWTGMASSVDHAATESTKGDRLGIDATEKLADETTRAWPTRLVDEAMIVDALKRRWAEFGLS